MDYLDIESFRSKYSDITVTAVPSRPKPNEQPAMDTDQERAIRTHVPQVEITRVNAAAAPAGSSSTANAAVMLRNRQQTNSAAIAYANEYKEVMAKLEYTKYMQAQLQMMSAASGGGGIDCDLFGTSMNLDENANIVDKYSDLLNVLVEMRTNVPTTMVGLRAPKERMQRDIAQARLKVRQCLQLLEQAEEESDQTAFQGAPGQE
ncbi:uncharacterized protein LOC6732620 [Drosophila simulans]|uniref:GD21862 n=1 Tax=Drosophila simulans TaxID=7240 RepID=B4Q7Z1_DROSI|nr:uncharacterized protein LOC6732620 [Drosophila simulans]EDX05324.1 GD21862 [Drosophila simulans]KMY90725.1 uncharacterized protein Dsimw501_GD21862 [Drosophila simulans]